MGDLKHISHKQFNQFMKGKRFKRRNDYKIKELKSMFGFKPAYDRRSLVISSEDMESTTFDSLRKASKAIGVFYGAHTRRYEKNKNRGFVKKDEKIYEITWC